MPKVVFVREKKEIEVPEGANLRAAALEAGIQVNFHPIDTANGFLGKYLHCFGHGSCGTCKVLVKKGMENLGPTGMTKEQMDEYKKQVAAGQEKPGSKKSFFERFTLWRMLSAIGHEDEMRLSCQVSVFGDCTVETRPPLNLSGDNFWQKPYPNK